MKVICTKVPLDATGKAQDTSPWVTVGAEYDVVSVIAVPHRELLLQIVDNEGGLGWFASVDFMTVDGTIPASWVSQIDEKGMLELAPAAWLVPGFWEDYYDGEPSAVDAVEAELQSIPQPVRPTTLIPRRRW